MDIAATLRSGLFWTGSTIFVLIGVAAALYGPALPAFARGFGIAPGEAGLLVSAHNAGGLAGLLLSAALGAVSTRQSLLILAAGAAMIAAGFAWWLTLVGGFTLGAGYGLVSAVLNRRFLTETGPNGPAMVGVLNAIFGIGAIAGPLLLVAMGSDPALAFGLTGIAFLAVVPFAGGGGAPAPAQAVASGLTAAGGLRALLARPAVLALGAAAIGFEVSLVGLGPTALVARGIPEPRAAEIASLFFAFFLASRFSLVWLAPRLAPLTLLALAFSTGAALSMAAAVLPPGAFYALAGASVGLLFPAYFVAASGRLGTDGRAAAMILAAGYVGAVILPAVMSGAIAVFGAQVLFPALATFALLAALGALLLARRP